MTGHGADDRHRRQRKTGVLLVAAGIVLLGGIIAGNYYLTIGVATRTATAQQRAGVVLGERLCTTFGRLAALKPPPGNPAVNPSRAYEQEEHATLDQLGTDLGCKVTGPRKGK